MAASAHSLPPAVCALIDALAELAVEDYLTTQASNDAAPSDPSAKPVGLPGLDRAA